MQNFTLGKAAQTLALWSKDNLFECAMPFSYHTPTHVVSVIDNFMISLNFLEDQMVRLLHGISQARLVAVTNRPDQALPAFLFPGTYDERYVCTCIEF